MSQFESNYLLPYLEGLNRDESGFCLLVFGGVKEIYLVQGNQVKMCFPVAIGENGVGKVKEGDKKTPLGDYCIKWMVSRNGPPKTNPGGQSSLVVDGETYSIRDSELYFGKLENAGLSEQELEIAQDEKLWTAAYGGEHVFVMALNYPNEKDKKEGKTGSSIEIHASAILAYEGLETHSGTLGCIALVPHHAKEIYGHIKPGTPVRIVAN
jgi:L,D-peptidoglycan transpeptidase YkuD (ErfK/YbiS/YcfS/YnhG family)